MAKVIVSLVYWTVVLGLSVWCFATDSPVWGAVGILWLINLMWAADFDDYLWEWRMVRAMRFQIKDMKENPQKYIMVDDGKEPDEEMIQDFYKDYLKKKERDGKHQWTTEAPMTLDEYRAEAKEYGKQFLFNSVSTFVMGTPFGGGMTYFR